MTVAEHRKRAAELRRTLEQASHDYYVLDRLVGVAMAVLAEEAKG